MGCSTASPRSGGIPNIRVGRAEESAVGDDHHVTNTDHGGERVVCAANEQVGDIRKDRTAAGAAAINAQDVTSDVIVARSVPQVDILQAGVPNRPRQEGQAVARSSLADGAGGGRVGNRLVAQRQTAGAFARRAEIHPGDERPQVSIAEEQSVVGVVETDPAEIGQARRGTDQTEEVAGISGQTGPTADLQHAAAEIPGPRRAVLDGDRVVRTAGAHRQTSRPKT